MAKARKRSTLIMDANVLIDYVNTDCSVLELAALHLGEIHVPKEVLIEVKDLDEDACAALGIQIVEPTTEQYLEAGLPRSGLSFQDSLCLVLAKAETWTCVTNDGHLRKACVEEGVNIYRGLELMIELVETGHFSPEGAIQVAKSIQESNRYITDKIVARFEQRVRSAAASGR